MSSSSSVETRVADVPAVLVTPAGDGPAPLVLCWHGFGPPASAEDLAGALPLDGLEAWKVYPDLPLFGRRLPWDGPRELGRRQADDYLLRLLWPVMEEAVSELPAVVEALHERLGELWDGRLALAGFSAGATAVLLALAERRADVRAAVAIGALPDARSSVEAFEAETGLAYDWSPEARRVAEHLDFRGRASEIVAATPPPSLLLVHGADDEIAPPAAGHALHAALTEAYRSRDAEARIGLEVLSSVAHEPAGDGRISAWLRQALTGAGPDGSGPSRT